MGKVLSVLLVVVIGAGAAIGGRWYMYVTSTQSPYDEVGIALNGYMPAPVRTWGCGKLHARFPASLPPYGCQANSGGKDWLR